MSATEADAMMLRGVLDAFRRREPDAVRVLYREYGRQVYAVARRVLNRADLAEDAVQQTFLHAWRAADRIDVHRDPAPWLATIAKRVAIDIRRYEGRRPAGMLADAGPGRELGGAAPDPDALDAVWHVRRAIDELPSSLAEIVRLHHLDGLTHSEISEKLEIPVGTVKSRSYRAHRMLVARLRQFRNS